MRINSPHSFPNYTKADILVNTERVSVTRFLLRLFFRNRFPPSPDNLNGVISKLLKIRGDIRKSRAYGDKERKDAKVFPGFSYVYFNNANAGGSVNLKWFLDEV